MVDAQSRHAQKGAAAGALTLQISGTEAPMEDDVDPNGMHTPSTTADKASTDALEAFHDALEALASASTTGITSHAHSLSYSSILCPYFADSLMSTR